MGEKNKILFKGISKFWGLGGECYSHPNGTASMNSAFDTEYLNIHNLPSKEYWVESSGMYGAEKHLIHDLNQNILECVKCKDTSTKLEQCNNCGNKTDLDWHSTPGKLFCNNCKRDHQQTRWICPKCNCDNSIGNTLFHWIEKELVREIPKAKEGCFIATACYGDYNSCQVIELRQFRDNRLLKTFLGKLFVRFYYSVSPFFATLISKSDLLNKIVRQYFLEPIVSKLKRQKNEDN